MLLKLFSLALSLGCFLGAAAFVVSTGELKSTKVVTFLIRIAAALWRELHAEEGGAAVS